MRLERTRLVVAHLGLLSPQQAEQGHNLARLSEATERIDDASLLSAIAAHDESAFGTLAERHAPRLHQLAYRMLDDRVEAEDVAQECLLRLWDHASRLSQRSGGVGAWLRRVATNQCLDRLRSRRQLGSETPPDQPDDTPGADVNFDSKRLAHAAQQALKTLPDRQRAAVALTYYEQLSNKAAADVLDMNVKAFESLLLRARSALRDAIQAAGLSEQDLGESV